MAQFYQKRTYESWQEIDTKTLLQGLILTKQKFSELDIEKEDFALTGNLLIDLYEISEELEKRLLFAL